jgi:hypothetical protein
MVALTAELVDYINTELAKMRSRVGTVTATGPGNQVQVNVGGTVLTLHRLSSYSAPTVGDSVLVEVTVQSWVVVGKILA